MEEIVDGWDIAKEHRVQDKSYGAYYDDGLLRQRDIVFPKQMYLSLNVFELLDGGHRLSLHLPLVDIRQAKKTPILSGIESGLAAHLCIPRQSPVAKVDYGLSGSGLLTPGFPLTRFPVVTHSGLRSFRARYSYRNSGLVALLFSVESK